MTREQTIEKLKALYTNAVAAMLRTDACDDDESAKVMTEYAETLDSAIKALETALQTDGDCISRQAAIDATWENPSYTDPMNVLTEVRDRIKALPSVQQEPLSDAYMKAVWTWLLNYQIKAAELKGRYTPYEVLSWVANDWRKEHEGLD